MRKLLLFSIGLILLGPILLTFIDLPWTEKDLFLSFIKNDLLQVLGSTIGLALGISLISLPIGFGLAYLYTSYTYPFKRLLHWLCISPLGIPIYVLAFLYYDDFYRSHTQHVIGLIFVFSLAMIPYVYLLSSQALSKIPQAYIDQSNLLNLNKLKTFLYIQLPLCKKAIIASIMIIFLESLADFGAVSIFNYETLSVSIYKYWYRYFSFDTAKWISFVLILFIILVSSFEWFFTKSSALLVNSKDLIAKKINPIVILPIFVYLFFALILPLYRLIHLTLRSDTFDNILPLLSNTLWLCFYASTIATLLAYLVLHFRLSDKYKNFLSIGYGIPGTFCAVAFIGPIYKLGLVQLTFSIMVLALVFRFIKLSIQNIENGHSQIPKIYLDAGLLSGNTFWRRFTKIDFPLYKPFYFASFLFVFVEVMKEMPIQLMTRPFHWQSLSIKIFEYTSEAEWVRAAPLALILCIFGFIPILLLYLFEEKN